MFDGVRRALNSSEYLRGVKEAVLRRGGAGHFQTIFPDDFFLVSYPRSGRTWSRFLIANLMDPGNPVTFANVAGRVPGNYTHTDRQLLRFARPRIIASHKSFYPYYPSVVYIVRDPRDVAVSRYYLELKRGAFNDDYSLDDFICRSFVTGDVDEYRKAGGWADHVLSWLAMRAGGPCFLLVRYEDLKKDTMGQLARLASFLKLQVNEERLTRAIELSSPERMRELDEKQPLTWLRGTRRNVPFVRKAQAGGWRTALSEAARREIESAWWPLIKLLGYDVTSSPESRIAGPRVSESTCAALSSLPLFAQNGLPPTSSTTAQSGQPVEERV